MFQGFKDSKQTKVMIMFPLWNNKKFVLQIKKKKKLQKYIQPYLFSVPRNPIKGPYYMVRNRRASAENVRERKNLT